MGLWSILSTVNRYFRKRLRYFLIIMTDRFSLFFLPDLLLYDSSMRLWFHACIATRLLIHFNTPSWRSFSILNVLLHLWLYFHSSIHIVLFHVTLNIAKMFEFYEKILWVWGSPCHRQCELTSPIVIVNGLMSPHVLCFLLLFRSLMVLGSGRGGKFGFLIMHGTTSTYQFWELINVKMMLEGHVGVS